MPKISQPIVINAMVPLPPFLEQTRISAYVMKLLAMCKNLEHQLNYNKLHINTLMKTILNNVFEAV